MFSPYYAWARRSGPADPEQFVGLNVALYGRPARWAMTERGRTALSRDATRLAIGPSDLHWDGTALTITIAERGMPLPRRIAGTVRVTPEVITGASFAIDPAARHRWTPIAPRAHVEVALTAPDLRWSGPGYLDANAGDAPLERDFIRWDWSCARLSRGAGLLYDTLCRDGSQQSLSLRMAPDGTFTHEPAPPRVPLPRTALWRVRRETQTWGKPKITRTLLDAPFYARSAIETRMFGETAEAMHESLDLDRFRAPVVQGMLPFRMPRWTR